MIPYNKSYYKYQKQTNMFKFLSETSRISSTRVTLFLGTISLCLLMMGVLVVIIIKAINCASVDWAGISIFIGALSAFIGTLLYGKVQQKKVESNATDKN